MATRGSALSRAITFFRTANLDEARVAFQLASEVMDERLTDARTPAPVAKVKRTRKAKQKELAEATQAHKDIREVAALVKGETLADA
jgi:hypothetical protein